MDNSKKVIDIDLQDRGADVDFKKVAKINFDNFYALKEALVTKRQKLCTMDQMAKALNKDKAEIAEFEQYYSDPTMSEVQEYALALLTVININTVDFQPDLSGVYSSFSRTANVSDTKYSYKNIVQIQEEDMAR